MLNTVDATKILDDFKADFSDILFVAENRTNTKNRREFEHILQYELLNSKIDLIDMLGSKARVYSNGDWNEINNKLRKSRMEAELLRRRLELLAPASQQQFEAVLKWMVECGVEEDLELLQRVKTAPSYRSENIDKLLETAEYHMIKRLGKAAFQASKKRLLNVDLSRNTNSIILYVMTTLLVFFSMTFGFNIIGLAGLDVTVKAAWSLLAVIGGLGAGGLLIYEAMRAKGGIIPKICLYVAGFLLMLETAGLMTAIIAKCVG